MRTGSEKRIPIFILCILFILLENFVLLTRVFAAKERKERRDKSVCFFLCDLCDLCGNSSLVAAGRAVYFAVQKQFLGRDLGQAAASCLLAAQRADWGRDRDFK
ncbi:MAG: hypothetical protein ABSH38_09165 [Verrucomicrobiota bacterium]